MLVRNGRPKRNEAAPVAPAPAATGAERMRRAIAAAMARSSREIPHFHLATTVDLEAANALLARLNAEREER